MDFLCPGGHVGKTESHVGLNHVVILDVEVNALEVDLAVLVIEYVDVLGKNRCQRYPVVTQHKAPGVIRVKSHNVTGVIERDL